MKHLLFIPIFFLMVGLGITAKDNNKVENLEITEIKIVMKVVDEVQAWLNLQTIPDNTEEQQAMMDFIGSDILEEGYNITDYGVMLLADPWTREPISVVMVLDMVFETYTYRLIINRCQEECQK